MDNGKLTGNEILKRITDAVKAARIAAIPTIELTEQEAQTLAQDGWPLPIEDNGMLLGARIKITKETTE